MASETLNSAWLARDSKHVWHPFTQMQGWNDDAPPVIERAEGNWLVDVEGNKYFDGVSSLWANVHGHNRKEINAAIEAQLRKVSHSTLLGLASTPSIELAEQLVRILPRGLNHIFYSDSGSTATEVALKMAFQYWRLKNKPKKSKFLALENSYHGDTLGAVSAGGISLFHERFGPLLFDVARLRAPHPYRWNTPHCLDEAKKEATETFERRARELAAIIIEPCMQGAAGMLRHPHGYLKHIESLCRAHDVLLICDEVATGFGRTGKMFAVEHENVVPDLLCMAKGLSGGYLPLAATAASDRVYEAYLGPFEQASTFFHGHTFTGNALACAAATANLSIFEKDKTLETLAPKIEKLSGRLSELSSHAHVGDIRQLGFMVGIELVKNKSKKEDYTFDDRQGFRVCQAIRKEGIWLRPLGHVVVMMPPLSTTAAEIDLLIDAVHKAIDETC